MTIITDPPKEQTTFTRKCEICSTKLISLEDHSIGWLHTYCPKCKYCPDCDEGAV